VCARNEYIGLMQQDPNVGNSHVATISK